MSVKSSLRSLWQRPLVTAVAVISLALGIGANTTAFTVAYQVFFRSMPIESPDRVVALFGVRTEEVNSTTFGGFLPISYPNFEDVRDLNEVFSETSVWHGIDLGLSGDEQAEQILGEFVSGSYFGLLGIRPAVGKFFGPQEDAVPGRDPVVVISHRLWGRQFGFDRSAVGRTIRINGRELIVVGVAPEGFKGLHRTLPMDAWIPTMMFKEISRPPLIDLFDSRSGRMFFVIARLNDGVDLEQARASVEALGRQLEETFPDANRGRSLTLLPLHQATIHPGERPGYVKAGVVLGVVAGLLLLTACANVANLLLTRALVRRKEIAVRLALGARRGHLIRQLLQESLLLHFTGAILALPVAWLSLQALWKFRGQYFQEGAVDLSLGLPVLLFTFAIATLAGLVFGLVPALQASKPGVVTELKEQTEAGSKIGGPHRWGQALVAAQVGLALVALVAAGLFIRSLQNAQEVDIGFAPDRLGVLSVNPGTQGYDEVRARQLYDGLVERARTLPEVESAALGEVRPFGFTFYRYVKKRGQSDEDKKRVQTNTVGPGYFDTVGLEVREGRSFSVDDRADTRPVAIVNQTLAEQLWPGSSALHQQIQFGNEEETLEVVGVVEDAVYNAVGEDPTPYAYIPLPQRYTAGVTLHLRTRGDSRAALTAIQREIRRLDPELPVIEPLTMGEILDTALLGQRAGAMLLSLYGVLILLLAALGIYGTMAYSITRRYREIGIRIALGARNSRVLLMILRDGLILAALGLGLGLFLTFFLSRFTADFLFDMEPLDPLVIAATVLLLVLTATAAILVPAIRAVRSEPHRVLKEA